MEQERLDALDRYPLLKAQAEEYVRESQRRLILRPVGERLAARLSRASPLMGCD